MAKKEDNKSINLGHGVGRRKTSVARVYLRDGNGKVTINGKDVAEYFVDAINAAKVVQPFDVTETQGKYDVVITVAGGGICSQAEACRHGLARALVAYDEAYRKALRWLYDQRPKDGRKEEVWSEGRKKALPVLQEITIRSFGQRSAIMAGLFCCQWILSCIVMLVHK